MLDPFVTIVRTPWKHDNNNDNNQYYHHYHNIMIFSVFLPLNQMWAERRWNAERSWRTPLRPGYAWLIVVCCIGFENILIGYPSTRPIREPRPFQVMLLEFINLLKASARTQSEYSRTSHTNMTREDFLCSSASPLKKTEDSVIHSVQNEMATGQVSIIISTRNPTTLAKTYTNVRSFKPNIHNVFFNAGTNFAKNRTWYMPQIFLVSGSEGIVINFQPSSFPCVRSIRTMPLGKFISHPLPPYHLKIDVHLLSAQAFS